MDLDARTARVLDWAVLIDSFAESTRTTLGAEAVRKLAPMADAKSIRIAFDAIDELRAIEAEAGPLPIGRVSDVVDAVRRAAQGGVLERNELRTIGATLVSLRDLGNRLYDEQDAAPTLWRLGEQIDIEAGVASEVDNAFDATGQLSTSAYPELAALRKVVSELHTTIRGTLEEMVTGNRFEDVLQDRFVTQRGDRYVIPIKAFAKNADIGIVHAESGSKRTVFIEPHEVVALNNRLRLAEAELDETEHRILVGLSRLVGRVAEPIRASLDAAIAVDLCCARESFARKLAANRPVVRDEGVIDLRSARHPVLQLRGVKVVPNDLRVGSERPALVLTGPNTGGKTVALKTMGLCALLVRLGCFVPAAEGSRVDLFPTILADVGDAQTIEGDLSSFSGHLVVLREMLGRSAPGCLFLLDELCSGTDPSQGGALAAAVLSALADKGPRIVATTHYAQLKGLATVDPRFSLGGMEYADGKPTFRVVAGTPGESHAFDTALRMGLPGSIVADAEGRMGESERTFHTALRALESERDRASERARQAEAQLSDLESREAALAAREAVVRSKAKELEQAEAARFLDRLKQAEKAVAAVVADLQRSPDHRRADAARATIGALREIVPAEPAGQAPAQLEVGDRVRLRNAGQVGEVERVGDEVAVRIGSVVLRVRPEEIERIEAKDATPRAPRVRERSPRLSADPKKKSDLGDAVRIPGNTLDLRGQRVEEAFDLVARFLADAMRSGFDTVFILHGHGTGALKDALRRELHRMAGVAKFAPANVDQGGDAYTVVALT